MAIAGLKTCDCGISLEAIICARCGGSLPAYSGVLSKIDLGIQQWFHDLDSESRLNQTLSMYMAIDRQVRQGAPVTAAVQLATEQIMQEFAGMEEKIAGEIESSVKEAAGALQSYVIALKLPGVRGEEGERSVLSEVEAAFLGQTCIKVEPLGGADATDAIVAFYQGQVEIGRCLIEVKSRRNWSNDYLSQTRADMKRYNAAFAILAVEKLPRVAKLRGYHIDAAEGMVITTTAEFVTPTVTMFYEIHSASYKLQKKKLDLTSLSTDRDLTYYIDDNMRILEDCKKISDEASDSSRKIKEHANNIGSRLQDNNRKIAKVLSKAFADEE